MSEDLAARLLAAIDEVERRKTVWVPPTYGRYPDCPQCGRPVTGQGWRSPREPVRLDPCGHHVTDDQLVAAGIARRNPDKATLRRCTADRKIVELHARGADGFSGPMCDTCVGSYATEEGADWPCDTLRALAEGYGLTEETTSA